MNSETGPRSASNRWSAALVLMMLGSLLSLGGVLFSPVLTAQGGTRMVPVPLQSNLRADYSADEFALAVPGVGIDIIGSAIQDQIAAEDIPLRLSTLISDLQTAVPTVTPQNAWPGAGEATATRVFVPTRRAPVTATSAPERPSDVPPTATATLLPTDLPTRTQQPTHPSPTAEPPTAVPPTQEPPTAVPPTHVPPTSEPYPPPPPPPPPPTDIPPTPEPYPPPATP
jgi:hypothetical protein